MACQVPEHTPPGPWPRQVPVPLSDVRFLLRCAPLTQCKTCYTSSVILGLGVSPMRRREFITLLGSGVAGWPLAALAQQPAIPVIGYLNLGSPESDASRLTGLRQGLNQSGYVEGRNLVIEYRWAGNRADRLPDLAADLVQLRVAVIVSPGSGEIESAVAAFARSPLW